jgi:hypothetical protein
MGAHCDQLFHRILCRLPDGTSGRAWMQFTVASAHLRALLALLTASSNPLYGGGRVQDRSAEREGETIRILANSRKGC